ncbi:hypothetical protein KSP40_PGU011438 [Platanthera guangdongensis]|uniref:Uncharacterized protein n=1 Tax=Platanthera guangdongensis TaxID=2320717 RepID=A0ABR2MZC9_9ASPA
MAYSVEIGAQGTIEFLISQEIEYFRRVDFNQWRSSQTIRQPMMDAAATNSGECKQKKESRAPLFKERKRKKKEGAERRFVPSFCSAVDVWETTYRLQSRKFLQK